MVFRLFRSRIALLLLVVAAGGCHGQAVQRVRSIVASEDNRLDRSHCVVSDPEVDAYVDDLGLMVLEAARRLDGVDEVDEDEVNVYDRFNVVVVHSTTLNAWVYGDDFTCMTTNLFLQAETPEEIVAVLCHEFGHLHEEHLVEAVERELAHHAVGDVIEILGGVAELASYAYGIPLNVTSLTSMVAADHRSKFDPNCPDDEYEADLYALELYASMGLDLAHFDDFFERTLELVGDGQHPTHPRISERLERIRPLRDELAASVQSPPRTLDLEKFRAAQDRLRTVLLTGEQDFIAHEEELRRWAARGHPIHHRTACGPLMVDPGRLQVVFKRALLELEEPQD